MAKLSHRTASVLGNPFDRFTVAPGIVAWVYRYRNPELLSFGWHISSAIELGIQLEGSWTRQGEWHGAREFGPAEVVTIGRGEHHAYRFAAKGGAEGVQVGFALYPHEIEGMSHLRGDAALVRASPEARARLVECAHHVYEARALGAPLDARVAAQAIEFVWSSIEESDPDPVACARDEIERTFRQPLYARHIAELVGLDERRLAERFRARYGVAPTSYRLEHRVNAAIRLAWSAPGRSLREIAEEVGFEDVAYLHRACVRKRGLTPRQLGRRR